MTIWKNDEELFAALGGDAMDKMGLVNQFLPPYLKRLRDDMVVIDRTPMGRFGEPDDIVMAMVCLWSPAAKFVTGDELPVDGGVSIGF